MITDAINTPSCLTCDPGCSEDGSPLCFCSHLPPRRLRHRQRKGAFVVQVCFEEEARREGTDGSLISKLEMRMINTSEHSCLPGERRETNSSVLHMCVLMRASHGVWARTPPPPLPPPHRRHLLEPPPAPGRMTRHKKQQQKKFWCVCANVPLPDSCLRPLKASARQVQASRRHRAGRQKKKEGKCQQQTH